ncbi:ABC transporter permease [Flavobacterium aquatile]|uniref:Membrane protein n=1 Tax=Flavobacterium aquatile LMG 4008 = ATCC 11947 TaxID=1453498 RepID=A0A095SRI5_9FLAO|nr:FtsX-like permease family protein [Flavobacterium aquatile]KGD67177.1 membrane protein [Flavobacterium aquatile LMG 4008 = ATCC 11947]OXA66668.1 ABC transporter permease [Flavobacterium aquatile LMG 4008 = ATCC 11947]GEC78473.1 membrane protein [Flavobacterium aquatile]
MNFPLYIAKRYIFSKSKNNAINIITRIASGGIIVGAMALFIVLSVFSGLRVFSLSFSNDFDPDFKANPKTGKSFEISASQEKELKNIDGIVSFSKIIEERVLFSFNEKQQVTYIKGVDSNFIHVNKASEKLFNGTWFKPKTVQVVVGYGISQKLSLGLFDFNNQLEVFVPKPGKGNIENPDEAFNKSVIIPVGIYAINEELDSKYVFADLGLTQELLEYKPNQISGIEFKTKPNSDEDAIRSQIAKIFNNKVEVKNRAELNATLYKMLNTENIAVYLIFTLVIIIALFNLIGALIMMILDKKANLKTLYNLGTEVKDLRKIFLLQGTLLSVFGGIIGLVLGIIVVIIQQQFQLIMITESLAYPVVFSIQNVLIVFGTIVTLGFIASLIASSRVSKKLLD